MSISDRMWDRALFLTRYDGTSTADMVAALGSAHYAKQRLDPRMGTNVPDTTDPKAITTHFLDTGLGAIVRASI
jgi:hypothetical protein